MKALSVVLTLVVAMGVGMVGCTDNADPLVAPNDQAATQNSLEPTTLEKKPAPSLECTIVYWFVGHLGQRDAEGRLLVWDGEIHGDIEGEVLWWFVPGGGPPNKPPQMHVSFYEARWEIWDGVDLLLAGKSAGTTALNRTEPRPEGKDGIWRGAGKVTEASVLYEDWNGRQIYEGGNVNWVFPYSGEGIFRIN